MYGVNDSLQEVRVARRASHILRRAGVGTRNAQRQAVLVIGSMVASTLMQ